MTLQISRSSAFRSVPPRKALAAREQTLRECDECSQNGATLDNCCEKCHYINTAKKRYEESNIPVMYWNLTMTKHYWGDPVLLEKFEEITNDLHKTYNEGICICFAGRHGVGKQLSLNTELPTSNGFIKLLHLQVGDGLFDENGDICKVMALHPINVSPESYKIEFDDGSKIEACAEHRWLTWDRAARRMENGSPKIRTTTEILNTLRVGGKQRVANHSIQCTLPLNYPAKNLLIDPYVLGAWLGDGTTNDGSIECADDDILLEIKNAGYSMNLIKSSVRKNSKSCKYRIGDLTPRFKLPKIGLLKKQLKELGVLANKHIPKNYLYSSSEQRLSLLQGLMDTDGCCLERGISEFCTVLPTLAEQVCQLILSFGIKTKIKRSKTYLNGTRYKDRYRLTFTTQLPVFRIQRKLHNLRLQKQQLRRTTHRYIIDVKPIDPIPMRCITVDSPSHLFLVTKNFVPTHNTLVSANVLKRAVAKGYQCLYTTLSDIVSMAVSGPIDQKFKAQKELTMVDFLVIDEFDSRHMQSGASADLFGRQMETVFRRRSENNLPTFMCTNSPKVLDSFEGPIRQSIASLMNYVTTVTVVGKDGRDPKNRGD